MTKQYTLGPGDNNITVTATIATVGSARTSVYQVGNGQSILKTISEVNANGNIDDPKSVGTITELKGTSILFVTTITFPQQPVTLAQLLEKLIANYSLDGGYSRKQTYTPDADDISVEWGGELVIIRNRIELN